MFTMNPEHIPFGETKEVPLSRQIDIGEMVAEEGSREPSTLVGFLDDCINYVGKVFDAGFDSKQIRDYLYKCVFSLVYSGEQQGLGEPQGHNALENYDMGYKGDF